MSEQLELGIDEPPPPSNTRFLCVSNMGDGLFGYTLYVTGVRALDTVLDDTLSDIEVSALLYADVDMSRSQNMVFLRSLAHIEKAVRMM